MVYNELTWPEGATWPSEVIRLPELTNGAVSGVLDQRIRAYVDTAEPAISGEGGHSKTFGLACRLKHGFLLNEDPLFEALHYYNQKCEPPWSERELQHKTGEAMKSVCQHPDGPGWLLKVECDQPQHNNQPRAILMDDANTTESSGNSSGAGSTVEARHWKAEIVLPKTGKNESEFMQEIVEDLPKDTLFSKDNVIVRISEPEPEKIVKTPNPDKGVQFHKMTPKLMTSWIEKYLTTGVLVKGELTPRFAPKSMTTELASHLLEPGAILQQSLPKIDRIIDVPIPIKLTDGEIVYPKSGFNKELGIYCVPSNIRIAKIPTDLAMDILNRVYEGFSFKDQQSKTHAIARLFTAYLRGIIGFGFKTPFWFFEGNRPGAGKDYCNAVTQMLYQGSTFEDAPLGDHEETRKRITAALQAGRRMMHFANCQRHLDDPYFTQAITDTKFRARNLGSTDASSDLELANEIEFSISAQIGLTAQEDIDRRMRKISLAYFEEHSNSRLFLQPYLVEQVIPLCRDQVFCAIYTLVKEWIDDGMPLGKTPFTSFAMWGQVVGGLMMHAGLGDPCLPNADGILGGDLKLRAMTALYEHAYEHSPGEWWTKQELMSSVSDWQQEGADDRLDWFGDLDHSVDSKKHRTAFGLSLKTFADRILGGIRMQFDTSSSKTQRHRIRFHKP